MKQSIKKVIKIIIGSNIKSLKKMLERNFKKGSNFFLIQIGAHDGISHDFLFDFMKEREPEGILIEPVRDYYDRLVVNYSVFPNLKKLRLAVHPTDKSIFINKIKKECEEFVEDWAPGAASIIESHLKKFGIPAEYIEKEEVAAETLMEIIQENYNKTNVDLLQIDVEGFDYEVLKMINFNSISPSIIKFEHVNMGNKNYVASRKLLHKNGYISFVEDGDTIGVKANFIIAGINNLIYNFYWRKNR